VEVSTLFPDISAHEIFESTREGDEQFMEFEELRIPEIENL
jgi:hypothetical protein